MTQQNSILEFVKKVVDQMPSDWLTLTTHRLDIYNEAEAKYEFLEELAHLYEHQNPDSSELKKLPTAYDYIRLGHPLSCVLEWTIAKTYQLPAENVISFSSETMPIYAILRENLLTQKNTLIAYTGNLPQGFDESILQDVYGYHFTLTQVTSQSDIPVFDGSTIYLTDAGSISEFEVNDAVDFYINIDSNWGSVMLINSPKNQAYVSKVQHVRRRETIAMTPDHCLSALYQLLSINSGKTAKEELAQHKASVQQSIKTITGTPIPAEVASSGLSMQYAIGMGLVHHALEHHKGKKIKFVVPPNCYGGTNDQARRLAECSPFIDIVDLPVDGDNDMVQSIESVLSILAKEDAVPYIIAEIPTNPRVEVPDLDKLRLALTKERKTDAGEPAIAPVFILDQTFCPNTSFLAETDMLAQVQTIAYVSGSKFPSGGKCTAGYCVTNTMAAHLMPNIRQHLTICDNEATPLQYAYLAEQLPSMNKRIADAYANTREFVNFIEQTLPDAKINFVSEELAAQGFTPSVFSLDLPTKGNSDEERETYKRALNLKLINLMISEIPNESKYCVSYGQLKGCYWTIPATSTQGTTKEGDKDYIARVAVSANMDLEKHKQVFLEFVRNL
jgi:cystathionine beta-lyase/cystathionine gamma-synthase